MPLLKDHYTSEDYWNLPEGERAELIDGKFYNMAPPSRIHQKLVFTISRIIGNHIADHHGSCEVYPAPFAVNLDAAPELRTSSLRSYPHPAANWTTGLRTAFTPSQVSGNTGL